MSGMADPVEVTVCRGSLMGNGNFYY